MRGKFSQTCKHFNSPKNDIKSSLGYFQQTGTLPMPFYCLLKFWRKHEGNSHVEISPGIPQGKEAEISTWKIPLYLSKSRGRGWFARWVIPHASCTLWTYDLKIVGVYWYNKISIIMAYYMGFTSLVWIQNIIPVRVTVIVVNNIHTHLMQCVDEKI